MEKMSKMAPIIVMLCPNLKKRLQWEKWRESLLKNQAWKLIWHQGELWSEDYILHQWQSGALRIEIK